MRFLHLVRVLTLLITVVGCFVSTPVVWITWLEQRLGLSGGIYESGYSYLTAALEIGVYITATSALILAAATRGQSLRLKVQEGFARCPTTRCVPGRKET